MKKMGSTVGISTGWLIIGLAVSPLILLFAYLHKPELERTVPVALIVILGLIKVCRDYRKHLWFWITILGIAALHFPVILFSAKSVTSMPFGVMLLVVILDGLLMLAIIEGIARMVHTYAPPKERQT